MEFIYMVELSWAVEARGTPSGVQRYAAELNAAAALYLLRMRRREKETVRDLLNEFTKLR